MKKIFKKVILILLIVVIVFNFYSFEVKSSLALSAGTVLLLKALLAAGVIAVGGVAINNITQDMVDMSTEFYDWLDSLPEAPEPGEPRKPPSGWENLVFKSMLGATVAYTFYDLVKSARNWLISKGSVVGDNGFIDYYYEYPIDYVISNEYFTLNNNERLIFNLGNRVIMIVCENNKVYIITNDYFFDGSNNWDLYFKNNNLKVNNLSLNVTYNRFNVSLTYFIDSKYTTSVNPNNVVVNIGSDYERENYNISDDSYFSTGDEEDITKVYPNLDNQLYQTYDDLDELFEDWKNSIDDSYKINPNFPPQVNPLPDGEGVQVQPGDIDLTVPDDAEIDFSPLLNTGIVFSRKFPFSIPWDLKTSIESLEGSSEAPVFVIPFSSMPLIGAEDVEIDFSNFNKWALIVRWGLLIAFNLGLIIVTRKLIRG